MPYIADCTRDAMRKAVSEGDLDTAQTLVANCPHLLQYRSNRRRNWIHVAVENDQSEMVRWLAREGVDINAQDREDASPLHRALSLDVSIEILQTLLECGANVNQRRIKGTGIFDLVAVSYPTQEIKDRTLAYAALLVKHGLDLNAEDQRGYTPLYYAATCKRTDIAFLLIDSGVDPLSTSNLAMLKNINQLYKKYVEDIIAYAHAKHAAKTIQDSNQFSRLKPLS